MSAKCELKDQAMRDIISQEIKTNLLVEAGAGSGKTSEMANRIIALISEGYRKIDEIVAITFTRKAANELKDRVRKALEDKYLETGNLYQKEAVEHIHECYIGTIHSFCSKLIRERPIEAGVDPGFIEIEESEDKAIRQKIWESYISNASQEQQTLLDLMATYGVRETVAKEFLRLTCEQQDVDFILPGESKLEEDVLQKQVEEAYQNLAQTVKRGLAKMPEEVRQGGGNPDGLQKSLLRFVKKTKNRKQLTFTEKMSAISIFAPATSVSITQNRWGEDKEIKQEAKALGQEFSDFRDSNIKPTLQASDAFIYNHLLIPFAEDARGLYFKYKQSTATLNFQDLLLKSMELLRDYPEVRSYFQNKYKTLLVDEFQDTDPIQTQLVMYLVGDDVNEKKWDKIQPKEGSLFVVGDPKQSIYGFRRADIEIYNRFKNLVQSHSGKIVELTTNFRSVTDLGSWYNAAFDSLLNKTTIGVESLSQAQFSGLDSIQESISGALSGVCKYHIDESKVDTIIEREPEILARIILWMVGKQEITVQEKVDGQMTYITKKVDFKDIMILSTKKRILERTARALANLGIPVKVTGADIINKAPEFITFANVIRMLSYPEENAYIYQVMENDVYHFSDHELFLYVLAGGTFNIYSDLTDLKASCENNPERLVIIERVEECFKQLRRFSNYAKFLSPAAASERIIEELGLLGRHLTSGEKLSGLGSFASLIEKIRLKNITDIWGLDLFINEILYMIENGFEEELDLEGPEFNAVRIMNTHKAKGLEAPIVILASPCSGSFPDPSFYVDRVETEDGVEHYYGYARIRKNPDATFGKDFYAPSGWSEVEPVAAAKVALEKDRLLYVAATRARNMLIIGSSAAKDNPWKKLIDLLPQNTENILKQIFEEEPEENELQIPSRYQNAAVDIDSNKISIKGRRDAALNANKATYRIYIPSEKKGKKAEVEAEEDFDLSKKIVENTLEIYIQGDEEITEEKRLELGTAIHKLFETLIKDESNLSPVIRWIVENSDASYITEVMLRSIAEKFQSSKIWDRVKNSSEVYTEVPFSYKVVAGNSFAGVDMDENCYINGYIDLIFRENDGWVIVDYKTCSTTEVKHELQRYYKPQLDAYKEVWESITGEKVNEIEIFFVEKHIVDDLINVAI